MCKLRWLFLWGSLGYGQQYDLVLKGGHVIDPGNEIDRIMDVAVAGQRIARVAEAIPPGEARQIIDMRGLYVTPGLIDLHTHVYIKGRSSTVLPDDAALPHGTTTIVDAGVAGWKNFDDFKATIIDSAQVRVLVLLNIVGSGMNDDQRKEDNVADMDPQATAAKIKEYPDLLIGVKTAHFGQPGWAAVERAVQAGRLANTPVMLDSHIYSNSGRNTREKVMNLMRPGDIHTHTYNDQQLELVDRFTRKVQPWMWEARARGVRFDLGHGGGSFLWPVARAAISQGFPPDTISTDLHPGSILTLQVNMPNVMSKLINLGMTVKEAVLRATVNPAMAIGRYPALGTLGEGRTADIAAFELRTGVFAFIDSQRKKLTGTKKLECVMTLRNGQVVFDRDAKTYPPAPDAAVLSKVSSYPRATPASQRETGVYDIVLKQGQVIDPANRRFGRYDIGITGTKIVRIARWIPAANARLLVDVGDYHVTPGLVDIDAAVNFLDSPEAVQPDHHSLPHGVTTVADRNASQAVVRRSRVRVLPIGPTGTPAGVVASRMNRRNVLSQHASMTRSLSLLLNAGTPLNDVIERATVFPAQALANNDVGVLKQGGVADIAVFSLEQGEFPLIDNSNRRLIGKAKLICVLTVRNGAVMWDLHGLSMAEWSNSGTYSNYR